LSLKEVFAVVFGLWNRQNVVALDVSRLRVSLIEFKFEFVKAQEMSDKFSQEAMRVLHTREESHERYQARLLERKILQHKADQPLDRSSHEEIMALEEADPNLIDELMLK